MASSIPLCNPARGDGAPDVTIFVRNIPPAFHTADLRAFFDLEINRSSEHVANDDCEIEYQELPSSFTCFHFKNRSEQVAYTPETPAPQPFKCCVIRVRKDCTNRVLSYDGRPWFDSKGAYAPVTCGDSVPVTRIYPAPSNSDRYCVVSTRSGFW